MHWPLGVCITACAYISPRRHLRALVKYAYWSRMTAKPSQTKPAGTHAWQWGHHYYASTASGGARAQPAAESMPLQQREARGQWCAPVHMLQQHEHMAGHM